MRKVRIVNLIKESVLAINCGSSSIKFAIFQIGEPLTPRLIGKIDRIGLSGASLVLHDLTQSRQDSSNFPPTDFRSAANLLINRLEKKFSLTSVSALGHRVVHGMNHTEPESVSQGLLDDLSRISSYNPDHLLGEIELIKVFRQRYPKLLQVACFDTAFHCTMPRVAKILPIPRRFDARGIQRYGFHGLSYAYLMEELNEVWTTDKDGITPALLSAEMTARTGRDPGEIYRELTHELGESSFDRVDAPATPELKARLSTLSSQQVRSPDLAGEKIQSILTHAPGNGAAIGGFKVIAENGWFAARPSGTEDIYKIYAESFRSEDHLRLIVEEAQAIVNATLTQ